MDQVNQKQSSVFELRPTKLFEHFLLPFLAKLSEKFVKRNAKNLINNKENQSSVHENLNFDNHVEKTKFDKIYLD